MIVAWGGAGVTGAAAGGVGLLPPPERARMIAVAAPPIRSRATMVLFVFPGALVSGGVVGELLGNAAAFDGNAMRIELPTSGLLFSSRTCTTLVLAAPGSSSSTILGSAVWF